MATEIIRESGPVDLGYIQMYGEVHWAPENQSLYLYSISGFYDLLATSVLADSEVELQAQPGNVIVEDWGASRKMAHALIAAGILEEVAMHTETGSALRGIELRVLTPALVAVREQAAAFMPTFSDA